MNISDWTLKESAQAASNSEVCDATVSKIARRILPLLMVCYFVAYLDRVNIGMAALAMNKDLGLTPSQFGTAASVFFVGYFIFEVPSNLLLERFGANRWIARIMITWGLLSACTAFVTGPASFYSVRFLLGIAEAGFFPGMALYFSWWFPRSFRVRISGAFMVAMPLSAVFGGPLSGYLLSLDGWHGLHGWQWLFLLEGLPSVALGAAVLLVLPRRPADAKWLPAREADALQRTLDRERARGQTKGFSTIPRAMLNPVVLLLIIVCFGANLANYGLTFWLPQIAKTFGGSSTHIGILTAIPAIFGAAAMVAWSKLADRTGFQYFHIAGAGIIAAAGLFAASRLHSPITSMAALCVASVGIFAMIAMFWGWAPAMMHGPGAGAGIALVSGVSSLAGFVAPILIGWVREMTGTFDLALATLSLGPLVSAVLVATCFKDYRRAS